MVTNSFLFTKNISWVSSRSSYSGPWTVFFCMKFSALWIPCRWTACYPSPIRNHIYWCDVARECFLPGDRAWSGSRLERYRYCLHHLSWSFRKLYSGEFHVVLYYPFSCTYNLCRMVSLYLLPIGSSSTTFILLQLSFGCIMSVSFYNVPCTPISYLRCFFPFFISALKVWHHSSVLLAEAPSWGVSSSQLACSVFSLVLLFHSSL